VHIGTSVGVGHTGGATEVPVDGAGLGGSTEQDAVLSGGMGLRKLIESDALATSSQDTLAGDLGESHGADLDGLQVDQTLVIDDRGADDGSLVVLTFHKALKLAQRHRSLLDAGHTQAVGDDLVELGVGTTGQELVKLDAQLQVGVVALHRGPLVDLDATTSLNIDTHFVSKKVP